MERAPARPRRGELVRHRAAARDLERFVDFDRIAAKGAPRVSVGAVDVETGNFRYFDNRDERLRPEHFMASGALPPGFPAVRVGSAWYWDGGLVSNTPLQAVLDGAPRGHDALVFQVDLWSAKGAAPRDLYEVANREKDIRFSSRTRRVTDQLKAEQSATLLRELLALVPAEHRDHPVVRRAAALADDRRVNVVHLIHDDDDNEGHFKDFEFSLLSMRRRWDAGLADARGTLASGVAAPAGRGDRAVRHARPAPGRAAADRGPRRALSPPRASTQWLSSAIGAGQRSIAAGRAGCHRPTPSAPATTTPPSGTAVGATAQASCIRAITVIDAGRDASQCSAHFASWQVSTKPPAAGAMSPA